MRKPTALFLSVFATLTFSSGDDAFAVVMYDEGREIVNGVSFLRDKEDPTGYYYLPTTPRVVIDPATGKPRISLIKFVDADGDTSGGLVHFLFSLDLPPDRIEELGQELKKKVPGARIRGPVVLRAEGDEESGGASFSIISSTLSEDRGESAFTTSLVSSGVAPVTPGSQAAVAARLSENGATLLWESLEQPTSDISVAINASYEAALPAYRGKVYANLDTVYNHFFSVLNTQQGYTKDEIRKQLDELIRTGVIEVDVTDRNGMGVNTSQLSSLMNLVTDKLVEMLFDTTQGLSALPEQEEVPANVVEGRQQQGFLTKLFAGTGNQKYVTDNQYTVRKREDVKRATFSLVFTQNTTIRVPFNTTGNISGLHEVYGEDEDLFRIVGLNDEAFDRREIFFEVDPGFYDAFQANINSVSVSFIKKYPNKENQADYTEQIIFNQNDVKEGIFSKSLIYPRLGLKGAEWQEYEFRTLWSFRGGKSVGLPEEMGEMQESSAPSITLAPPAELTSIELDGDAARMVDAGIRRGMVEFSYRLLGEMQANTIPLNPGSDEILTPVTFLHDRSTPIQYKVRWYQETGDRTESDWQTLEDTYLFLLPDAAE
jgi:hypothetical protein